jgi:hypothetical protein
MRSLPSRRKSSKSAKTMFPRFFPDFEVLEIRWMPSITSAFQRVVDPVQSTALPVGLIQVNPNTGTARIAVPLDFDFSPGTSVGRNPALVYDSATIAPRPIIEATLTTTAGLGLPTQIQAQLTFNGTTQSWVTFSTSGHSAGDIYTIDTQAATAVTATGAYSWSLSIKTYYSGSTVTDIASGTAYAVVHNLENEIGMGWSFASVDSLVPISGGIIYVSGSGGFRVFTGSSGTYTNPANEFGTLVKNVDGTYQYTAEDHTQYNLNKTASLGFRADSFAQIFNFCTSSVGIGGNGNQLIQTTKPGRRINDGLGSSTTLENLPKAVWYAPADNAFLKSNGNVGNIDVSFQQTKYIPPMIGLGPGILVPHVTGTVVLKAQGLNAVAGFSISKNVDLLGSIAFQKDSITGIGAGVVTKSVKIDFRLDAFAIVGPKSVFVSLFSFHPVLSYEKSSFGLVDSANRRVTSQVAFTYSVGFVDPLEEPANGPVF